MNEAILFAGGLWIGKRTDPRGAAVVMVGIVVGAWARRAVMLGL